MKRLALLKLKVIWFRCKGCFKGFPVIKYAYVACLKAGMIFVFADLFYLFLWFTEQKCIQNPVKLRWSFFRK